MEKREFLRQQNMRYGMAFIALIGMLLTLFVVNVNSGSVHVSVREIYHIIVNRTGNETAYRIIWDIRLPRLLAVVFLGGALSVSGFLLQTFFGNPIAGPFVLGISSGAKLAVSIVMIFLLERGFTASSTVMIAAAFCGAMISMGFVLVFSKRVPNMAMLVICGVMIGYICSAMTDFLVTFANDSNIVNLHNWSLGSFSGMDWEHVKSMSLVVVLALFFSFMLSKPIQAYQMGEEYAKSVGVNVTHFRVSLILLSSVLAACVTAFAGPISFVGIAVPHLMKGLLRTTKPILLIPACFLGGAVFCLFSDWIARMVFAPVELSISSVTAVLGAPVVIYIMIQRQKRR